MMNNRFVSFYISSSVFLFYALSINIPSGYGYGAILLLISVFFLVLIKKNEYSFPLKKLYFPIVMLLGYFSILVFDIIYHDLPIMFFDNPSRFLMAALVALVLARSPPSLNVFWAGIIVGAMAAGSLALYQKYSLNFSRASGYDHSIQFGNLSILLSFFCISGITWAKHQKVKWVWISLLMLGALMGLIASLLSQARGGWVAIPVVMFILFYSQSKAIRLKDVLIFLLLMLSLFSALYFIPQTGVESRVRDTMVDLKSYANGNTAPSIGNRFTLWKNAIELSKEKPIAGYGELGYLEARKLKIENKQAPEHISKYNHVHNDYLDALVKRGIIGLIGLLLLYGMSFIYFFRYLRDTSLNVRSIAQAGIVLISSYSVFGLSQGFLVHHSGVIFFAFSLIIIVSLLQKELHSNSLQLEKRVINESN